MGCCAHGLRAITARGSRWAVERGGVCRGHTSTLANKGAEFGVDTVKKLVKGVSRCPREWYSSFCSTFAPTRSVEENQEEHHRLREVVGRHPSRGPPGSLKVSQEDFRDGGPELPSNRLGVLPGTEPLGV